MILKLPPECSQSHLGYPIDSRAFYLTAMHFVILFLFVLGMFVLSVSARRIRGELRQQTRGLHKVPDGVASSDALTHGGLMSQIKRNLKHSVAGAFEPPFDPVRNLPAMFSKEAIGGRTVFTNPMSNPHVLGLPFTPNGDHNTWPEPVKGFETRIPSIAVSDPMRSSDYGSASNPPMELGNMRPMVFAQTDGSQ